MIELHAQHPFGSSSLCVGAGREDGEPSLPVVLIAKAVEEVGEVLIRKEGDRSLVRGAVGLGGASVWKKDQEEKKEEDEACDDESHSRLVPQQLGLPHAGLHRGQHTAS